MNKKFLSILLTTMILAACSNATQQTEEISASHNAMSHDSMTMEQMTDSMIGKTGDDLDKAFIEAMIPHHEGAVDMARVILDDAKHQELRTMAADIIRAQEAEITLMKQWYENWGYGSL